MQLRHLAEKGSHRYNRILKSRQFGFTTLYCIDLLDEALWVPGMSCAILAHEQKYNEKIFSIVKRAFDNIPAELKPITKTNTKYAYDFVARFDGDPLDSSIYVATGVRSGTVQKLHITETAWIKDFAEIKAGAKQAVPKTGTITEETTANGFNEFFDDYSMAEEIEARGPIGDQDYKTYFYAWWENPEYTLPGTMPAIKQEDQILYGDENDERAKYNLTDGQLLWRRWKINELRSSRNDEGISLNGLQLFRQEYPGNRQEAFQSGAGNIFDVGNHVGDIPLTLDQCHMEIVDEAPRTRLDRLHKLGVKFWVLPKPGRSYVMGIDPSDGEGADFGPIDVWDKESLEQVAQFYGKVRPDELAEIGADLGWFYNEAFIGVENNMLTCVMFLSKIYTRYFFETKIDERTAKKTKKIGWNTNTKTRDPMIDEFIIAWEEGDLKIHSNITYSEMKTFVRKDGGKREHANGKHDDALFSAFIALQMRKLEPRRASVHSANPFS